MSAPDPAGRPLGWPRLGFVLAVLALGGARLHLTHGIPSILRRFAVDDLHFQVQAEQLAEGRWLGPYGHRTLIKGPGYPLFLAGAHHSGLPRRSAEDLLRLGAALLLLFGLRRLGLGRALALLAFAAALFSFDGVLESVQRPVREHVYASQVLALLGLGLALLAPGSGSARLVLTLALGALAAWLHHTREEGPWILPAFGVLALGVAVQERARGRPWRRGVATAALLVALTLGMVVASTALLRRANERHYGAPVVTEWKDGPFRSALAALRRVALSDWTRYEPLTAGQRAALYAASPAFDELRDLVESGSHVAPSTVAANGERMFTFLSWVVRDAAARAGHHASLAESRAFYRRLAEEVNAACDAGRIPAAGPVSGAHPGLRRELWGQLLHHWAGALVDLVADAQSRLGAQPARPLSDLEPREEARRRRFLNETLPPPGGAVQRDRLAAALSLSDTWMCVLPAWSLLGLLALLLCLVRPRRALASPWCWAGAAVLVAVAARTFLVAVIETYWWTHGKSYLHAVSPLVAVLPVLGVAGLSGVLGIEHHHPARRLRDGLAVAGLVAFSVAVLAGVPRHRGEVVRPLTLEEHVALRQPGSRVVVSAKNLSVRRRSRGLGVQPPAVAPGAVPRPSILVVQVLDLDRTYADAVIELVLPGDGAPRPLHLDWAGPVEALGLSRSRTVHVPTGRLVALRLPLEPQGVGRYVLRGFPLDGETHVIGLGCLPAARPSPPADAGPSVRAWISHREPRQLVCEVRGARPGITALVQFARRRRATLLPAPGVAGALEIDLDAPLLNEKAERLEFRLEPDDRGFATVTWPIPEGVRLPRGPIYVQAALPGRFTRAVPVEPLVITPGAAALPPGASPR